MTTNTKLSVSMRHQAVALYFFISFYEWYNGFFIISIVIYAMQSIIFVTSYRGLNVFLNVSKQSNDTITMNNMMCISCNDNNYISKMGTEHIVTCEALYSRFLNSDLSFRKGSQKYWIPRETLSSTSPSKLRRLCGQQTNHPTCLKLLNMIYFGHKVSFSTEKIQTF